MTHSSRNLTAATYKTQTYIHTHAVSKHSAIKQEYDDITTHKFRKLR